MTRHQNHELGAQLLEEALEHDPDNEAAFTFLRELWGDEGATGIACSSSPRRRRTTRQRQRRRSSSRRPGRSLWRQRGNLIRARAWFERLAAIAPEHPSLRAFEAQIGEQRRAARRAGPRATRRRVAAASEPSRPTRQDARRASSRRRGRPRGRVAVPPRRARRRSPRPRPTSAPPPVEPVGLRARRRRAARCAAPRSRAAAPAKPAVKIDELLAKAEKQERRKRYNEYVKTLMSSPRPSDEPTEKVDLYAKAADLYIDQVREPGRGGEGVRGDPRASTARTRRRSSSCARCTRSAATGRSSSGCERREAERLPRGPSARAKFLEIAQARHRARQEARGLHRALARGHRQRSGERRGAQRARAASTSAPRTSTTLAERAREAGRGHLRQRRSRSNPRQARRDLRRSPEQRRGRGRRVARAPRARSATIARRKRRSRRSTSRSVAGTTSRSSTPRAASGTSSSASSSSKRRRRPSRSAKIGMLFKIAELWARQEAEDRSRGARLREGPRARRRRTSRAAEALIPHLRAGRTTPRALAERDRGQARATRRTRTRSSSSSARSPASTRASSRSRSRRSSATSRRSSSLPRDEQTAPTTSSAPRKATGRLGRSHRRVPHGDRRGGRRRRRRARHHAPPQARSRAASTRSSSVDDALAQFRAVYDADSENADGARRARASLPRTRRATAISSASTRRSASSRPIPASKKQIRYAIAKLYETEIKDLDKRDRRRYNERARRRADGRARARRRSTSSTASSSAGSRTSTCCAGASSSTSTRRELIDLKFRLGQTLEKHLGDAAGALENYREILFLDARHTTARARRSRRCSRTRTCAPRPPASSRTSTRSAATGRSSSSRSRSSPRAEGDVDKRVALLRKVARIAARDARTTSARLRGAGRGAQGRSAQRRDPRRARAHRRAMSSTWDELDAIFERDRRGPHRRAARARVLDAARRASTSALGKVDEAAKGYVHVLSLDPADAEALDALEALYRRTERWTDLIGVYRASHRARPPTAPSARRSTCRWPSLRRAARQARGRRSRRTSEVLELDADEPASRSPRSTRLFTRQRCGASSPRTSRRSSRSPTDDEQQIALMLRLAALRETRDEPGRAGDRGLPPGPRARPVERRGARARSSASAGRRRTSSPSPRSSSRSTARSATTRSSSACTKSRSAAATTRPPGRAPPPDRAALRGRRRRSRTPPSTRSPARSREDPANEHDAARARPPRPRDRSLRGSRAGSSRARRAQQDDPTLASTLYTMSARVYETDIGDIDSAIAPLPQVLEIDADEPRRGRVARAPLPQRRALRDLSLILQRKAEILDDAAREEGRALPGSADRGRRPRAARSGDRRLQQGPRARRGRRPRARRADQALPRPLALGGPPRASTRKKADLVADPDEKKRIYYQVGAVYERELGDVAQAIDTYQRSPRARSRRPPGARRASTSSTSRAELAGAAQRPPARDRAVRSDPAEAISYQYRIAELYEKHLDDDDARHRALSRDPPADAGSRADARGPRRAQGGRQGSARRRAGARAGLRRRPASGRSSSASSRCRSAHADDPFPKVDLLHRIARLYEECSTNHALGVRHLRARASRSTTATRTRSQNLERLAMVVNRWPRRRRALRRGARQARRGRRSASSSSGCASRRSSRSSSRTSRTPSRATAACSRSSRRTRPRSARSIGSSRMTERWAELVADPRARGRDRADARRDPRVQVPPRQVHQTRLERSRRGDRRVPRRAQRRARARSRRARPSKASSPRASSRSRSARSSSRSTRPSGEWEKLAGVHEAQLAHLTERERRAPRDVLPHRRAAEEKRLDRARRRARRLHARRQGVPARREDAARRSSASPARSTAAGRRSPTPTPTCSACTTTRPCRRRSASASRESFEEELGDIAEGRRDVPLRAQRRAARRRGARPTSTASTRRIEQWPELARHPRAARQGDDRALRAGRALRAASARSTRSGSASSTTRSASFRAIFDELDKTQRAARSRPSSASTSRRARGPTSRSSSSASSRTPSGDVAGGRDPRQDRAPRSPTGSTTSRGAIETWKRVLDLRGEDPEALGALAEPLRAQRAVGRARATSSSVTTTSPPTTTTRVEHPHSAAPSSSTSGSAATTRARRLQPRPRHRLRQRRRALRDRRHLAPPQRSAGARRRRCTRRSIAPRPLLDAEELEGDLPRARQDLRRALAAAVRRGRRLAQAARGRPARLRGHGRAREPSTAPRSAGPRSSTSRCGAPQAYEDAAGEDPRVPRGRRASGSTRSARRTRRRPRTRRSSRSTPTHDEAFLALEELHGAARPLRAAHRALPRAPRHARGGHGEDRPSSARSRKVFEEKLDDKHAGVRRAPQRASRWTSTTCDDGPLPRAHGAGHRPLGRAHPDASTTGSRQQTEPQPEDHALPAPRQVVRRGPRSPRVRAAVLRADRSRSTRTTSPCSARWRSSIEEGGQLAAAGRRRSRARSTSPSPTSIARRSSPSSASCSSSQMSEIDQGARLLQARARRRSAPPPGARGPRAHLRRRAS